MQYSYRNQDKSIQLYRRLQFKHKRVPLSLVQWWSGQALYDKLVALFSILAIVIQLGTWMYDKREESKNLGKQEALAYTLAANALKLQVGIGEQGVAAFFVKNTSSFDITDVRLNGMATSIDILKPAQTFALSPLRAAFILDACAENCSRWHATYDANVLSGVEARSISVSIDVPVVNALTHFFDDVRQALAHHRRTCSMAQTTRPSARCSVATYEEALRRVVLKWEKKQGLAVDLLRVEP